MLLKALDCWLVGGVFGGGLWCVFLLRVLLFLVKQLLTFLASIGAVTAVRRHSPYKNRTHLSDQISGCKVFKT